MWRNKNIFHYPEIEPNIIQLIVWSLNLLSYFGLPVHSHTLLSGDTETAAVSETAPALARGANGSPEPGSWHIFYLSSSWDSPPPRPPARPSLPYQLMLSSLISYNYFTSSFPSRLLSLILKSGKSYPSGTKRRVAWGWRVSSSEHDKYRSVLCPLKHGPQHNEYDFHARNRFSLQFQFVIN